MVGNGKKVAPLIPPAGGRQIPNTQFPKGPRQIPKGPRQIPKGQIPKGQIPNSKFQTQSGQISNFKSRISNPEPQPAARQCFGIWNLKIWDLISKAAFGIWNLKIWDLIRKAVFGIWNFNKFV